MMAGLATGLREFNSLPAALMRVRSGRIDYWGEYSQMAQGPLFKITTSRKTPDWLAFTAERLRSKLRGKPVDFSFDEGKRLYRVRHGEAVRYGKDRPRSIFLYRDGFKGRGAFIFKSYCLQNILFAPDDVVIDCGANSGDLGLEI